MTVWVTDLRATTVSTQMNCAFPAAAGHGTIEPAALQHLELPPDGGAMRALVGVDVTETATFAAGIFPVSA